MDRNASIVCKIVPKYKLQMQIMDIMYMPLSLLFGILIGLLPVLLIISNLVTKPLRQVSVAIRKFSLGDFEQRVEITTNDEVGEVARCFNKMVEDIRTLIEKNYIITLSEKESELAALQAQINPHFLYNTLDALYWQATEAGNDEIAESILALSQLFRLVLSQGKNEVTVGQEMELISRYLQIQKMRFTKRLNYEVDMEEAIRKAKKAGLHPVTVILSGYDDFKYAQEAIRFGAREYLLKPVRAADILECLNRLADECIGQEEKESLSEQQEQEHPLIRKAKDYIIEHYAEDISLSEVAEHLGISGGYLSTLMNQSLKCGFVDYLNSVRIERACCYLEQDFLKNYEIAYKVGFRDEKYFSKVFKKIKGITPKEYRTIHR